MAREVKEMTGAEIRQAMRTAGQDGAQWEYFESSIPDYDDNRWRHRRLHVRDRVGDWWMILFMTHKSGDGRENGLTFKVYPVIRQVEMIEKVRWLREREDGVIHEIASS